jgi:hypothetical protein
MSALATAARAGKHDKTCHFVPFGTAGIAAIYVVVNGYGRNVDNPILSCPPVIMIHGPNGADARRPWVLRSRLDGVNWQGDVGGGGENQRARQGRVQ